MTITIEGKNYNVKECENQHRLPCDVLRIDGKLYSVEEVPVYTNSDVKNAVEVAWNYAKNVLHVEPEDKVISSILLKVVESLKIK